MWVPAPAWKMHAPNKIHSAASLMRAASASERLLLTPCGLNNDFIDHGGLYYRKQLFAFALAHPRAQTHWGKSSLKVTHHTLALFCVRFMRCCCQHVWVRAKWTIVRKHSEILIVPLITSPEFTRTISDSLCLPGHSELFSCDCWSHFI